MADLGRARDAPAPFPSLPQGQNFFIFMQFSGKIGQIVDWRLLGLLPLWEILDPPLDRLVNFILLVDFGKINNSIDFKAFEGQIGQINATK